ncbi:MAG: XdhC family protein [Aureispira sp.]|nr:XdhC family protein [Aureispira sp.]
MSKNDKSTEWMEERMLWEFVITKVKLGQRVALLFVPESIGSSPGRQGHQMAVSEDATLFGTIGGGAMEYKQVEACKKLLVTKTKECIWQQLIHDKSDKSKWSGLSCSGEQTVLTFFLEAADIDLVQEILLACLEELIYHLVLKADNRLFLEKMDASALKFDYHYVAENVWTYRYILNFQERVYLIGAGHVGLALCRQLALLNFKVILIDNRPELPTEEYDEFISKKIITSYKKVANFVLSTQYDYIVIMSFSSALDTLVLSQLIDKEARYIGMMASKVKVDRIRATLLGKGHSSAAFERIHTPIGLPIKCKSPAEIAVSVAAQIIDVRNSDL